MARIARNRNAVKQATLPVAAAKVALYLRVSTEGQANDGNGLEAQRSALLARCDKEKWADIVEFEDAGISGKSTDRPQFQAMMDAARAGAVQVVMAAKLDRIARNTVDFLQTADELTKAGVRLVMLEPDLDLGTPAGRMMATMFAAFAEWERNLIAQRVMGGKVEQAEQGEFNGSPIPYGYAPDWKIIEAEAETVKRIFCEFNAGKPLSHIAAGLNQDGITTRNGKAWKHQQVKHIVRNGTYAGLRQWNGGEKAGGQAAIVTLAEYRQAEQRHPKRGNPKGNPTWRKGSNPPAVAVVVERIFSEFTRLYAPGSLSEIAAGLTLDDIPPSRGKRWHASTVKYILSNDAYVAIVGRELFDQAQARLQRLRPGRQSS